MSAAMSRPRSVGHARRARDASHVSRTRPAISTNRPAARPASQTMRSHSTTAARSSVRPGVAPARAGATTRGIVENGQRAIDELNARRGQPRAAPACHVGTTRRSDGRGGRTRERGREHEVPDGRRSPPQHRARGERDEDDERDLDRRVQQQSHFCSPFFPDLPAFPARPDAPAFDCLTRSRDALEFLVGQLRAFTAEQRRDGVFGRAIEERVDEVAQRRLARRVRGTAGE